MLLSWQLWDFLGSFLSLVGLNIFHSINTNDIQHIRTL